MATMTKLFEKVTADDYEWIEQLILSKKKVDWNCIRYKLSLIYRAIEVRALKTFDLLIGIPEINVYSNTSGYINGLTIALKYYMEAPNISNKYYLDRLLQKNIHIDLYTLYESMKNEELFTILFNRINKTENNIRSILSRIICNDNIDMFKKIYDYIESNDIEYYKNYNKDIFNNKIFETVLQNNYGSKQLNKVPIIDFMIEKGCEWKTINNIPTLYYIIKQSHKNLFNYFLLKFKSLSKEELENINDIKNLSYILIDTRYNSYNTISLDEIKEILKLPIEFNDISSYIINLFAHIYRDSYYSRPELRNQIINKIYFLLNENKCKTNPYNYMTSMIVNEIKQHCQYVKNRSQDMFNTYIHSIRNFICVLSHFNFNMSPELMKSLDCIPMDFVEEYKTSLIKKLNDEVYPIPVVKDTKPKSRKKKVISV